jgi:hypothetical protein
MTIFSLCLYQTQALSDARMTHNSSEKKLTSMIEIACSALIGKKRFIVKTELH